MISVLGIALESDDLYCGRVLLELCILFALQKVAMKACLNEEFLFKINFLLKSLNTKINSFRYDFIHYTYSQRVRFPSYMNHRYLFLI